MRRLIVAAALAALAASGAARALDAGAPAAALETPGAPLPDDPAPAPQPLLPDNLQWAGRPDMPAVQAAWMLGSEKHAGLYVLRVRLAADGRIAVHAHPDERLTSVLSGTLHVGFGSIFDETRLVAVPAGAIYVVPADQPHYLWAKDGDVEYQESGHGPSATRFDLH